MRDFSNVRYKTPLPRRTKSTARAPRAECLSLQENKKCLPASAEAKLLASITPVRRTAKDLKDH